MILKIMKNGEEIILENKRCYMNLKKYDDKLVRITCIDGKEYEGISYHNSSDYDFHEFGVDEESLQITCFIFYKSDIKKVICIDKFSDKYGLLEKEIFEDGIELIEEVFDSEEDEHIYRLLIFMKEHLSEYDIDKDELIKLLNTLIKYNKDENVIKEAILIKNEIC